MARLIVSLCSAVAVVSVTFLVEPLFPLGDWRWAVVAIGAMVPVAFVYRDTIRGAARWRPRVRPNGSDHEERLRAIETRHHTADLADALARELAKRVHELDGDEQRDKPE
ncbi:MAG: hypothetical protein OXG95_06380 [Chloroflexi bacterium]|nr:hypothetical protein [Chloroflexota bacterium]